MAGHDGTYGRDSVLADALKGAVTGGIAVWVQDQVDGLLSHCDIGGP